LLSSEHRDDEARPKPADERKADEEIRPRCLACLRKSFRDDYSKEFDALDEHVCILVEKTKTTTICIA
jgi:hypothetical protein